ncbi:hypothetical protein [Arthrobacter globiformis]|uniref:hypothetical protein n=1 Tax=Arthrobacter globiformis TaxID=1665 RepID=UPI00278DB48B|nr:hypothetical protein [Arthrobacter globiformis]MDQ0616706.1 hypothetical protein [Arthrobacter globiformis]
MIPSITQQLKSIHLRFKDSVMPVLPDGNDFVHEQAQLISAALEFLIDTHEHEYRYEVIENIEYRNLLNELSQEAAETTPEVRAVLSEAGPAPQEASIPLSDISDQNRRMKEVSQHLFNALVADSGSTKARRARKLMAATAERQVARELAWYRLTGFPQEPGEIGAVLAVQHG